MREEILKNVMTRSPHCIGDDQTLAKAHEMMREYNIRHLPVLHGGKLVGILTDRDLDLIEALPGIDPETINVEEAMSQNVYSVTPETPVGDAAKHMAAKKFGCAVIMEGNKVAGVFTTVDALTFLAET